MARHGHEWWSYDDLKKDVRANRRQLWFMDIGGRVIAAGLTSIIGNGQVAYIDAVHGKCREAWAERFDQTIADWARWQGCREIRTRARKGWHSEAAALGWRETHREYRKGL
jgi:hypothetical protein